MRNMARKTVFSLLLLGAVVCLFSPLFVWLTGGVEAVRERWYFISGPLLALVFAGVGIWLHFRWPAEKIRPVEPATMGQKIFSVALFLVGIPLVIGVMWYMWTTSERGLSQYLLQALLLWIGLLVTIAVVSVWRKRRKAGDASKP